MIDPRREAEALEVLRQAARLGSVALASSLSAEDMVLTDMIARHGLAIDVFAIDTGMLHEETLALIETAKARYGVPIAVVQPDADAVARYETAHGRHAFYESVDLRLACCGVRKVEPLSRALAGRPGWITGQRRGQSAGRADLQPVETDAARALAKFNPLAEWSWDEVLAYAAAYDVPVNPLHARGYPSIGCATCTRAVRPGEDPRAGRWWWEDADARKECGLHAPAASPAEAAPALSALDRLEAEAVHILREAAAEARAPALLFSGGKDSAVLLHLARKAFWPDPVPFPLLHVDTGHNFAEVIAYRDAVAARLGARLIVAPVEESIRRGTVRLARPTDSRNAAQAVTLLEAIEEHGFDALFGGARRDEEKARAKERIVSLRDEFGQWNPKAQRPEVWSLYNARVRPGEHVRVFPLSNWTERDIWRYIARERIDLPSIYFAHVRAVVRRRGLLAPVTPLTPARPGETVETLSVRFRTVGDITCTCPVESAARDLAAIIAETEAAEVSERGATRLDDQANEAAMERRKREGYF